MTRRVPGLDPTSPPGWATQARRLGGDDPWATGGGTIGDSIERTLAIGDFRRRFYGCLGRRADALFELTDAILTSSPVVSLVHLSLATAHRRCWGSLYAGLSKGELDAAAVRRLLASYDLDAGSTPVYAVDVSP